MMYDIPTIKKKKQSPLDLYLLSVIIVQIGGIIRVQLGSQILGNSFRIIGFVILMYSIMLQLHSKNKSRLSHTMIFLLLWNTINILYTTIDSGINLTRTFGEEAYLLTYILPYILIFDIKSFNLKKLFKYALFFAIMALFFIALNYKYIALANSIDYINNALSDESITLYMAQLPVMWSIPAAMLFMNSYFIKNKYVVIAFITFLLATAFSMAFGRRGTSLYGALFFLSGVYMYLTNSNISRKKRDNFKLLIFVVFVIALFAINHFSLLLDRGLEDSRSSISDAFYEDMQTIDYIFGRGLNGTYYDPLIIFENFNFQRPGLETGYLNIILHAGLLYLIPYLMICLTAFYYGMFRTKNNLTKSFAIYILINTVMLPVGSYPIFNLRFFILWIGIVFCYNRSIRSMTDNEIKSFYNLTTK